VLLAWALWATWPGRTAVPAVPAAPSDAPVAPPLVVVPAPEPASAACVGPGEDTQSAVVPSDLVRCVLPAALEGATLVRATDAPWWLDVTEAPILDGGFDLPVPDPDVLRYGSRWVVDLDVPGVGHTTARLVEVEGGWACELSSVEPFVFVQGRVRHAAGHDAWVEGCGRMAPVGADGTYRLELTTGRCTLRAHRRDGAVPVAADPVDLDAAPGERLVVDFDLPAWEAASVGAELEPAPDGALVTAVRPGTPADDAGLLPGDVVLAIDGEEVVGLGPDDRTGLVVGPEGTEVTYTVLRDGEAFEVTLVREPEAR
jgi:hypothetical protein